MDELSVISCDLYRGYVRKTKIFVPYFRSATPEQIGQTAVGFTSGEASPNWRRRVAARHTVDFAWTQNRLMLPAWLGAGTVKRRTKNDRRLSKTESPESRYAEPVKDPTN